MADKYRTTLSIVFWSPDPDTAEERAAVIQAEVPEQDQKFTIETIEYVKTGRPVDPEPPAEPEELERQPDLGEEPTP